MPCAKSCSDASATGVSEKASRIPLSVVIPTKNRAADLVTTLETILVQTVLPSEVIIVDQSATDGPKRAVDVLRQHSPELRDVLTLAFVYRPDVSGSAEARNVGIGRCTGDLVLFLDDDVRLEKDFIEQIIETFRSHPDAVGVSGIITNYLQPPLRDRLFSLLFIRGPFRDPRQEIYWRCDALRGASPIVVDRLGGGLMCFPRRVASNLRFDRSFVGYSLGEDVEFSIRAARLGPLFVQPKARLQHMRSPGTRDEIDWRTQELQANCYLYHKHWSHKTSAQMCFRWLRLGFLLHAVASALRRRSMAPFRNWIEACRAHAT